MVEGMGLFFEDPWLQFSNPRTYGVLYLIRRDILTCLGWDVEKKELTDHCALWPAAIILFAGIDLLAKFYAGSDDKSGGAIGIRFKNFIVDHFPSINKDDEEVIYQLRNALLHSFGLYSKKGDKEYLFTLSYDGSPLVRRSPPNDLYLVDLTTLHNYFNQAIEKYKERVSLDSALQANFRRMYANYGMVRIG